MRLNQYAIPDLSASAQAQIAAANARGGATARRGRRRGPTPEAAVVRSILDGCARMGIPAYRLNSGAIVLESAGSRRFFRASWVGAPDILVLLDDGATLYVECKSARGRLSPEQLAFRKVCVSRGTPHVVARDWSDVEVMILAHRGRA